MSVLPPAADTDALRLLLSTHLRTFADFVRVLSGAPERSAPGKVFSLRLTSAMVERSRSFAHRMEAMGFKCITLTNVDTGEEITDVDSLVRDSPRA